MNLSWKTFWSVLGCSVTSGFGVLPAVFDLPAPAAIVGAAGAAVAAVSAAKREINQNELFVRMQLDTRDQMVRWIATAAGGHVAWVTGFQLAPALWPAWIGALGTLSVLQYWIARWVEHDQARRERRQVNAALQQQADRAVTSGDEAPRQDASSLKTQRQLETALELAELDHLEFVRWEPVDDRGLRMWVAKPPAANMPKKRAAAQVASQDTEEQFATAMSRVVQQPLESRWIQISKEDTAGLYRFVVMNQDVLSEVIPYEEDLSEPLTLTSIEQPAIQGYTLDGEPRFMRLDQHGQNIGLSGSGKSATTQCNLCHITRCADALSWVCGTEKLYDLVSHWIEPYDGSSFPIPIDWIMYGPADTAEMLAAAMRVIRRRQGVRKGQRKAWKKIVITLDEASFALDPKLRSARAKFEGVTYTATDLVAMILKAGKSAGVFIHLATQRGTQDHFGDKGGDVVSGFTWSNTFRSNDPQEVGRNTGDYQIPTPRKTGELVHYTEDGTTRLKAPYPQEDDASKAQLHEGITLSEIAWSRRNVEQVLDDESAEAAGSRYLNRHRYMNADLIEYLTGQRPEEEGTADALESDAKQAANQVLANLLGEVGKLPAGAGSAGGDDAGLPENAGPAEVDDEPPEAAGQSVRQRVATICRDFGGRLSKADIAERLRADGGSSVSGGVLANALTKMVDADELHRPEEGVYLHPLAFAGEWVELVTASE